jgi:O-antigen/teichoic acid export membrane protein
MAKTIPFIKSIENKLDKVSRVIENNTGLISKIMLGVSTLGFASCFIDITYLGGRLGIGILEIGLPSLSGMIVFGMATACSLGKRNSINSNGNNKTTSLENNYQMLRIYFQENYGENHAKW